MSKIEIKNKKIFKNKWQMIIYLILFGILFYMFIYLGNMDYNTDIEDNVRFHNEYNLVSTDNVFKYVNSQDASLLFSLDKAIILFGFKNDFVNYYAKIVNDAAINTGIETVYFYDFLDDRNNNNGTYEKIVGLMQDYITYNDLGKEDIYAPTLVVIKNKKIIYFDDETSFIKGKKDAKEYWNETSILNKRYELEDIFNNLGV